jgi:protein gp37
MNRTKIEWCDMTWSPVTGCLFGCEYCYARRQAKRFEGGCLNADGSVHIPGKDSYVQMFDGGQMVIELEKPVYRKTKKGKIVQAPYPYGFNPTYHRYRLDEPQRFKVPSVIFVCSMGELFGSWLPERWIIEVFQACEKAPWHTYMFLTKKPSRIGAKLSEYFAKHKNWWIGTTVTSDTDYYRAWALLEETSKSANKFLSIEPLHGSHDLDSYELLPPNYKNKATRGNYIDWVITGAETGHRKGRRTPERKWVQEIVKQCRNSGVPVFMKGSLADTWGAQLIQETPHGICLQIKNVTKLDTDKGEMI